MSIVFYPKDNVILKIINISIEKNGRIYKELIAKSFDKRITKELENDIITFITKNINEIGKSLDDLFENSLKYEMKLKNLIKISGDSFTFEIIANCIIKLESYEMVLLLKYFNIIDYLRAKYYSLDFIVAKARENIAIPNFIKIPLDNEIKTKIMLELI